MNSDPQFPKLPSLNELLQHPAVEKVVDRLNQSTIAQRATGFLSELQSSLQETAEQVVPSLNLIAERFAHKLLDKSSLGTSVINATGEVCSESWSVPLADSALRENLRALGEFHNAAESLHLNAIELLIELTGAEAAFVINSYESAAKLIQEAGIDRVDMADSAGLKDPKEFGLLTVPTIAERIDSDIDVVVCEGSGLIGGPKCGIILGNESAIVTIRQHPWANELLANANTLITLIATLGIYRDAQQIIHQIPVWQLLSAPLKNLQQRAERLAQLIEANESIATAEPIATDSVWYHSKLMQLAGPTWVIKIQAATDTADPILSVLEMHSPQILARTEADSLLLDLRSVFPRWDQSLVEVFQTTQSIN